ncbi:MAG: tRNA adenosine(34) deaminase TadA [Acidobacteria bacterium]|nr:tRNA adenosine(34) deaminase TadA [Acidobacteriota bacterium]
MSKLPPNRDEYWMAMALAEARAAEAEGEVPVGAVIIRGDELLATGRNRTIGRRDPTAHAEMEALRAAALAAGNHRLGGCTLYVTLEPCAMCVGAVVQARVDRLVHGTRDVRWGCLGSKVDLGAPGLFNHTFVVTGGVRDAECRALLQAFFRKRRKRVDDGPPGASFPFPVYSRTFPGSGQLTAHAILHPTRPRWTLVNDTGFATAKLLCRGLDDEAVSEALAGSFEAEPAAILPDVRSFREQWHAAGMDGPAGSPSPRTPALESLQVHVTERCNLRCPHCYAGCPSVASPRDLPFTTLRRLLREAAGLGFRETVLSGGEPLLHPELKRILAHAASRSDVTLLTNGTLVDEGWASALKRHVKVIQVSLDGPDAEVNDRIRGEGAFEAALRGLRFLLDAGLGERISLAFTLMEGNLDTAESMVELASRLGVKRVRFLPLRRMGEASRPGTRAGEALPAERKTAFYERIMGYGRSRSLPVELECGLTGYVLSPESGAPDETWCPLGRQLWASFDGDVYPCSFLTGPEYRLGNFHTDSLKALLASPRLAATCRTLAERVDRSPACRECRWRGLCQGGCLGMALHDRGSTAAPDGDCAYRISLYEKTFDRLLERFLAET